MLKYLMILMLMVGTPGIVAHAQPGTGGTAGTAGNLAQQKEALHLNTIGAFSAGFVLQCYGYIGVLADAMSKGVYEPSLVRSMLGETVSYLSNVNTQLQKYQLGTLVAQEDQKFIASIMDIVQQLIAEAEALSAFAQTKSEEDLKRFEGSRKKAWDNIKKTFKMN